MQPIRMLAAAALVAGVVVGQVNPFVIYPQDPERESLTCTSFVGRPDVANAAEALVEIRSDDFRGIGDANGFIRLFGVYHWVADEKLSTVETYDLVVRAMSTTGPGPDMSTAGEYLRVSGLTTPPSTNPNRGTWIMSDGFGIQGGLTIGLQSQVPPYSPPRYYVGVDLPANPLWPTTDGHSLFRADMLTAGTGALVGENHRLGAPHPTWAGLHGAAPSFSTPWSYVLGPFVTSPNLHLGGVDPTSTRLGAPGANYGLNGLYPDISGNPRSDGITLRITDNLAPFGILFLGAAPGWQPAYYEWSLQGTLIGHSHIGGGGALPIPLGISSLLNGKRDFTVALPNTIAPALAGTSVAFQAIVWDLNTNIAEWTDAQEVHL